MNGEFFTPHASKPGLYCLSYASVLVMLRRVSSHLLLAIVVCTASLVGGLAASPSWAALLP